MRYSFVLAYSVGLLSSSNLTKFFTDFVYLTFIIWYVILTECNLEINDYYNLTRSTFPTALMRCVCVEDSVVTFYR